MSLSDDDEAAIDQERTNAQLNTSQNSQDDFFEFILDRNLKIQKDFF